MTKQIKKIIESGLIGIAVGNILSIFFSFIYAGGQYSPLVPSFSAQFAQPIYGVVIATIIYALIGVISALTTEIYQSKLSLLFKSLLHMVIVMVTVVGAGSILHWFSLDLPSFLSFLGIFLAIYFIIWTFIYFANKARIEELNQRIKNRNSMD